MYLNRIYKTVPGIDYASLIYRSCPSVGYKNINGCIIIVMEGISIIQYDEFMVWIMCKQLYKIVA